MMEWLPIETAPRDGSVLLLWRGLHVVAGWFEKTDHYDWYFLDDTRLNDDETIEPNAYLRDCPPTHWMPLPSPPMIALPVVDCMKDER